MVRCIAFSLAVLLLLPATSLAITLGQVDDFENGTTMNWDEGLFTPNPPMNVASGGPLGAGDNYLRNVSSGTDFAAGGKMVQFNMSQWAGDYVAAGVTAIQMMAANFGPTPLFLRIAVEGALTQYGSTNAATLPADGQWHPVTFFLDAGEMSLIGGLATLDATLADVTTLRLMSRQSGPGWQGDPVAGTLGVDVISAGTRSSAVDPSFPAVRLLANAPNPFAATTRIRYELTREARVRLEIFDLSGRRVRVLEPETLKNAGVHDADWDGRNDAGIASPAGIYFYRLLSGRFVQTKSMVLIRD